ncbi:MAG: hypothetical protein Q8K58_01840 [Acidimicrobiales bacterium]|nr:hypothetical protein [Acidimicrobiales bacterium]
MATHVIDAQKARPVEHWVERLKNAVALERYATVDLRNQPGPEMVTPEHLIEYVTAGFQGVPPAWSDAIGHLQALQPLGIETVAMKAERRGIRVVIGRVEPGGLDITDPISYSRGLEIWLGELAEMLPKVKANDSEKRTIATLSNGAGYLGGPVVADAASKLLIALIEASSGGTAVTIHPIYEDAAYAKVWSETDLTSLPSGGIANRNWLWELTPGRITEAAEPNDFGVGAPFSASRLTDMITATTG